MKKEGDGWVSLISRKNIANPTYKKVLTLWVEEDLEIMISETTTNHKNESQFTNAVNFSHMFQGDVLPPLATNLGREY